MYTFGTSRNHHQLILMLCVKSGVTVMMTSSHRRLCYLKDEIVHTVDFLLFYESLTHVPICPCVAHSPRDPSWRNVSKLALFALITFSVQFIMNSDLAFNDGISSSGHIG